MNTATLEFLVRGKVATVEQVRLAAEAMRLAVLEAQPGDKVDIAWLVRTVGAKLPPE